MTGILIPKQLRQIPYSLWILGIADALLNVSAAMIFTISGPFMKDVLKSSCVAIGMLEGIVELVSWSSRLFSGVLSDYLRSRKTIMVIGYVTVILSRPILALATSIYVVLLGRSSDRIGKGIQATPREALVADISPSELRGACFGLRHSLGMVGSLLGALLVVYIMRATQYNYRLIFWMSSVPALLALLFLIARVHEVKQPENKGGRVSLKPKELLFLGKGYRAITSMSVLYMLCRCSEVFIALRALELGMAAEFIPLIMMTYNISEALISYPIGRLSDYIGRPFCIGIALICLSLANFLIGSAESKEIIFLGSILWGIQRGIGYSVFLSWIADKALPHLRATAYGAFYLISGISIFFANLITGLVISHTSSKALYIGHSFLGIVSLMGLVLWSYHHKREHIRY